MNSPFRYADGHRSPQKCGVGTEHQKWKDQVVLRGDIVENDSDSYAAFTEQGSSESPLTAAEVVDAIASLPGCAGQAADAVSAYAQV